MSYGRASGLDLQDRALESHQRDGIAVEEEEEDLPPYDHHHHPGYGSDQDYPVDYPGDYPAERPGSMSSDPRTPSPHYLRPHGDNDSDAVETLWANLSRSGTLNRKDYPDQRPSPTPSPRPITPTPMSPGDNPYENVMIPRIRTISDTDRESPDPDPDEPEPDSEPERMLPPPRFTPPVITPPEEDEDNDVPDRDSPFQPRTESPLGRPPSYPDRESPRMRPDPYPEYRDDENEVPGRTPSPRAPTPRTPTPVMRPEYDDNPPDYQRNHPDNPRDSGAPEVMLTPVAPPPPKNDRHVTIAAHTHATYGCPSTPTTQRKNRNREDENCCLRCLRCLGRVPCATLSCWVFMVMSVAGCAGAIMIGMDRTRDFLDQEREFLQLTNIVCIGVILCMLFLGTMFLLVAVISSGKTSKRIFSSSKKNVCGRVLNGFIIVFMMVIQFIWIVTCSVLLLPLALILILHMLYNVYGVSCFNLRNYAITSTDHVFCGQDLARLYYKSEDLLICYAIAYICAIFTVISMTYFIMCAGANIVYLKESRFVTYNVYRNDIRDSRENMEDTKM